jgi:hypothetical protein
MFVGLLYEKQSEAPSIEEPENPIACPTILVKHSRESKRWCVDMRNLILTGDSINVIHAIKELVTNDLELTEFSIAEGKDHNFAEGIEPRKAVFFRVGAGVAGGQYTIEVTVGTLNGDVHVGQCRLRVVE